MITIWKFPLTLADNCIIEAPANAAWLTVQAQYEELFAWAMVDTNAKTIKYRFRIFGTGHPIDGWEDHIKHLGTVIQRHFVWHVFIVQEIHYPDEAHP